MTRLHRTWVTQLRDWLRLHPLVLPVLILVIGGIFRLYNINWDNGHQLHPDERWIYEVVSGAGGNPPLGWPHSLSQFFNISTPGGSPLDPHFFAYGSLPFYLLTSIAGTITFLGQHIPFLSGWAGASSYENLPYIGRTLSALLDLGTVALVGLIGRRVFGYWTAVLAMALVACTVLDIQLSHFYAVDTVLVPLCLLTLLAAIDIVQSDRPAPYIWGGIALGAALATKTTALLLVIPFGLAGVVAAWQSAAWIPGPFDRAVFAHYRSVAGVLNRDLQRVLLAFFLAGLTFVVLEPYAVLDRSRLVSDLAQQQVFLVSNNPPFEVPYTIQYAHTIPYLYQLKNILWWDMGAPLALAAFTGVIFFLARWRRLSVHPERLILLAWIIPYFLFVGSFFAKFSRYMLPIIPVTALLGAALLVWLLRRFRGYLRLLTVAAVVLVAGGSFLYSLAYMNIYAHPNTRVAASRWIFDHVKPGTTLAVETPWDDPLPLDEQGHSGSVYHDINLDLYASDGPGKVQNITDALMHAQYIVMSSERMIGSIPKLPDRYPSTVRYYHLLFAGKLNFRLVKVFQQHPQLGPFVVHDYPADESFHVYDHPIVRIFRRTGPITPQRVAALLATPAPTAQTAPPTAAPAESIHDTRLTLTAAQWHADQKGPTMDQMFPPNGFAMHYPILVWLVVLELLGLAAFPLTFLAFRRLMDRGFVLAKTMGLLLVGYVTWILPSIGLGTYDRGLIVMAALALGVAGLILYARLWRTILAEISDRWRYIVTAELVFLAGFALFALLRMWYPDLGHQFSPVSAANAGSGRMGEKQMELAFLNAIARSRVFPPLDPFFSHGYINYYYYGFMLVATLCKLTQIVPATGFNLAIATFFGLLMANVFSVGLTLTRRIGAGILTAAFVGIFTNLNGAVQVIQGLLSLSQVHWDVPLLGGVAGVISGLEQVVTGHQLPPFDYWGPTRIIPPVGAPITEFPYFTYLFADLHPHLIAYPMDAAAIALAVNLLLQREMTTRRIIPMALVGIILLGAIAVTNPWDYPTYLLVIGVGALLGWYAVRRRISLRLVGYAAAWVVGLALGSAILYLPFKLGYQTVFTTGIGLVRDITPEMLTDNGIPASNLHDAVVTPLSIYLEHFGLFIVIICSYLAMLLARSRSIHRTVRRWRTNLAFTIYYRDRWGRLLHASSVAGRMRRPEARIDPGWWVAALILVGGLFIFDYYLLAALSGLVLIVAFLLWRDRLTLPRRQMFVLALILAPLLLSIGTQIVFVKDWLADGPDFRMNTIFKFYNQAWLLYAVCAGAALHFFTSAEVAEEETGPRRWSESRVLTPLSPQLSLTSTPAVALDTSLGSMAFSPVRVPAAAESEPASPVTPGGSLPLLDRWAILWRRLPWWTAVFVLLAAGCLVYTYAGTIARETYRQTWLPENSVPFTLDGSAFMKVAYPGDYRGIAWLNAHVPGAPVIAEADDSYYNWRSRVSMFTGLPDIINGIHEPEQRYSDELDPSEGCGTAPNPTRCVGKVHARSDDLATLYNSTHPAQAWTVIRKYGVRYIYVGFSERQMYRAAGLAKFDGMVGHGLRHVFHYRNTDIYQVVP